jgi:hypothetical protein
MNAFAAKKICRAAASFSPVAATRSGNAVSPPSFQIAGDRTFSGGHSADNSQSGNTRSPRASINSRILQDYLMPEA